MHVEIGFNKPIWRCADAIARLLIEDGKLNKLAQQVETIFTQPISATLNKPSAWDDAAWQALKRLRNVYPTLTPSLEQHPLLWIRFGFELQRRGVDISDSFMQSYSQWRKRCANELGGTMVFWKTPARQSGGVSMRADCALDYFIHAPNLPITIESDVEISISHVRTRKKGTTSTKSSTSDHVGSHACRLIEDKITDAAVLGTIKGLTTTKDSRGRYTCSLTRDAFTKKLREKYPVLTQYKQSTIIRTLSDFVACSWPETE